MTTTEEGGINLPARGWVVLAIAAIFICWIGYNTNAAREETERQALATTQFSNKTNDCLTQVLVVLRDRSQYTLDSERIASQERKALQDLFLDAMSTPLDDTVAKQALLKRYFDTVNPLIRERMDIASKRADNPYPDPTCGLVNP
jgi:hypothetical protein